MDLKPTQLNLTSYVKTDKSVNLTQKYEIIRLNDMLQAYTHNWKWTVIH